MTMDDFDACFMKMALREAASRRGSSITIFLPWSHGSSNNAGGTTVVLPLPGGAVNTTG